MKRALLGGFAMNLPPLVNVPVRIKFTDLNADFQRYQFSTFWDRENPCGIVVNVLDCNIAVSGFKSLSCNYVSFRTNTFKKGASPFKPPLQGVKLYDYCSFYNDSFSIKWPKKVDMPLNIELKTNQRFWSTYNFPNSFSIWLSFEIINN